MHCEHNGFYLELHICAIVLKLNPLAGGWRLQLLLLGQAKERMFHLIPLLPPKLPLSMMASNKDNDDTDNVRNSDSYSKQGQNDNYIVGLPLEINFYAT